MQRLFSRLVSRLGVTGKLATIYLLDLLVTLSIVVTFVSDKATQIEFSQKEREGTAIFAPARQLYLDLVADAHSASGAGRAKALARDLAATDQARLQHGGDMQLDGDWAALRKAADAYDAARVGPGREAAFRDYQEKLGTFLAGVGDRSNLILDPDLDSFYAMDITVVHMREMVKSIEEYAQTAMAGAASAESKTVALTTLAAGIRSVQADIAHSMAAGAAGNADGRFLKHLGPSERRFDAAIAGLIATVDRGGDVKAATDEAMAATFSFWSATITELNRLLDIRVQGLYRQTFVKLGVTLVLALGVLCAVAFIGLQIARPVRELVSVAASIGSGDPRRANWDSGDEFGTLVTTFNGMLDRLAEESKQREELTAAARAAEAERDLLEAIATPVVVTSLDGSHLLHANAAARELLGEQSGTGRLGLAFVEEGQGRDVYFRLAAAGALDEVEVQVIGADGAAGWMLLSARRVVYHGGEVALLSLTTINELKRAQAELSEAKEAAEIAAERLRSTTETLMASIRYASRIQNSIFPDQSAVDEMTHGVDIWVEQRDIVGGDWHWVGRFDDGDLVFLCDCTGHGVPGALMTMLVSACFGRVIDEQGHRSPALILDELHRLVRNALSRESREMAADDGLDAICVFLERGSSFARVASARLLMLHANARGLHEIKGDRTSIGYPSLPERVEITEHRIPVAPGDLLYLFTDGCTDQIGGDRHILFGRRRLVAAIDKIRDLPPAEQIARLREVLTEYRRDEPVRDDASLIILDISEDSQGRLGVGGDSEALTLARPVRVA